MLIVSKGTALSKWGGVDGYMRIYPGKNNAGKLERVTISLTTRDKKPKQFVVSLFLDELRKINEYIEAFNKEKLPQKNREGSLRRNNDRR